MHTIEVSTELELWPRWPLIPYFIVEASLKIIYPKEKSTDMMKTNIMLPFASSARPVSVAHAFLMQPLMTTPSILTRVLSDPCLHLNLLMDWRHDRLFRILLLIPHRSIFPEHHVIHRSWTLLLHNKRPLVNPLSLVRISLLSPRAWVVFITRRNESHYHEMNYFVRLIMSNQVILFRCPRHRYRRELAFRALRTNPSLSIICT